MMLKDIISTKVVLLLILLISHKNSFGQFYLKLHYEEFEIDYRPKKIPDTVLIKSLKSYPNNFLKIYITGEKGESHFELYNKQNHVTMKGSYANSPDTLCKYSFSKSLGFTDRKFHYRVYTIKYFQPLQKGSWCYFNDKQKLLRRDEYDFTQN